MVPALDKCKGSLQFFGGVAVSRRKGAGLLGFWAA